MFETAIRSDPVLVLPVITAALIMAFCWCVGRGLRNVPRNWRRRHRLKGEAGFAYAVSMLLTLPFVMLIFLGIIEMAGLFLAMIGVAHAGSQAARAAMVRTMPESQVTAEESIRYAAAQAMVPYAPGRFDLVRSPLNSEEWRSQEAFVERYRRYTDQGPIADDHLAAKFAWALRMTRARLTVERSNRRTPLVTVRYEHPFLSAFYGAIAGHRSERVPGLFTIVLETSVQVPQASTANDEIVMEIDYDPAH